MERIRVLVFECLVDAFDGCLRRGRRLDRGVRVVDAVLQGRQVPVATPGDEHAEHLQVLVFQLVADVGKLEAGVGEGFQQGRRVLGRHRCFHSRQSRRQSRLLRRLSSCRVADVDVLLDLVFCQVEFVQVGLREVGGKAAILRVDARHWARSVARFLDARCHQVGAVVLLELDADGLEANRKIV